MPPAPEVAGRAAQRHRVRLRLRAQRKVGFESDGEHHEGARTSRAVQGFGRSVAVAVGPHGQLDRLLRHRIDGRHTGSRMGVSVLSIAGYRVKDDGRVATTTRATTDSEAAARSERLHKLLSDRGAHRDVLRYCRPELVRTDFYEAVFESIKGLGHRLRTMSGETDEDGPKLVEAVLEGSDPLILLNDRANRSQRDEQRGVALLMKGMFAAFRNPAAHEPKIVWTMTEQDALDVLGTLSMVHRRLDAARLG